MNESCFGLRIQWKGIQKKRLIKASKRWKLYALRSLANKRRHKYNWGCVLSNYKLGFHGTSWLNKQNPHSLFNPFLPSVHFFGHKYTKTLNGLFRTTEILLYTLLINFLLLLKTIYIYMQHNMLNQNCHLMWLIFSISLLHILIFCLGIPWF
jgi:hypothetical protein